MLSLLVSGIFINPIVVGSDAALRFAYRNTLVVYHAGRDWLPLLQSHLYALNAVRAPFGAYALVPLFYNILTLFLIQSISLRILAGRPFAQTITFLALINFVTTPIVLSFGTSFYQEMMVFPLIFASFYLYFFLGNRGGMLLLVGALSLLTREDAWFAYAGMLFVIAHDKEVTRLKKLIYTSLSIFPVVWLWSTETPITTLGPIGKPLQLYDSVFMFERFDYFLQRLQQEHVFLPLLVVLGCLTILMLSMIRERQNNLDHRILTIFAITLVGACGITVYGFASGIFSRSPRSVMPFVWYLPLWLLFVYGYAFRSRSVAIAHVVQILIALSLLSSILLNLPNAYAHLTLSKLQSVQKLIEIPQLQSAQRGSESAETQDFSIAAVGINGDLFRRLILPVLVEFRPKFYRTLPPYKSFDVLLVPEGMRLEGYTFDKSIHFERAPAATIIDVLRNERFFYQSGENRT